MRAMALICYALAVVLANVATDRVGLVPIGFGLTVTAGTFLAGAALVLRDWLQIVGGRALVLVGIGIGTALSYALTSPALAVASALAFLASELVDWSVFTRAARTSLPRAVLLSSLIAAPVDTVLFLGLAGFPLTWQAVAGQWLVKTAMAGLVAGLLAAREGGRDVPVGDHQPHHP